MLTIRLQRVGRKNSPDFRIVLAEKHRSASKQILQVFGKYNPRTKDFNLSDQDALLARIKQNIEMSPTVKNLLIQNKLIEGKKVKAWRPKIKEKTESSSVPPQAGVASADKAEAKPEQATDKKVEDKNEHVKSEEPKKEVATEVKAEVKPEEKITTPEEPKKEA